MTQELGDFSFGTIINVPAIIIKGPFDFTHQKIDIWIDEQIAKGTISVILDLSAAHYITSMGIACMFKIVRKISTAGGMLHIAGATSDMVELISLAKLDRFISYIIN